VTHPEQGRRYALPTGVSLYAVGGGQGRGGPPVVFVNGLTMDTGAWGPVAERLGARFSVWRYDCRGQGRSAKPEGPYRPEQHRDDLLALLDALGLEHVHLVGLSNGGLVAQLAAARAPSRVASLAVVDSFARLDAVLSLILHGWLGALQAGGPGLRFDVATPWVWGQAFLAANLNEVLAFREVAEQAEPHAVEGLIAGLATFADGPALLGDYAGPLLAIVGEDDVLTPPRYSREVIAAAGRGECVVLPGVGHAAPVEAPDAVAAALLPLLERA
jgi:3-oxoadipate enol-lactonase